MFKKISFVLLATMTIAACGSNENNGKEANDKAIEKEEAITVTILDRMGGDNPAGRAFEKFLEKFDSDNPDIIIDNISIPDETSFNTRLQTMVAQGNPPDIFYSLGGASDLNYINSNIIADISDVLAADSDWADQFNPSLFDNWKFEDREGVYGIPREPFGVGLFYNKELFEKVGVEPPATIEQFISVSQAFLEHDIIPMALGDKDSWRGGHLMTNLAMKKYGSQQAIDLANRSAKWTDPEMVEILTVMNDFKSMGIFGENVLSMDYNNEKAAFHNGETAMHMDGVWYIAEAIASKNAEQIDFVPFPYFEENPEGENRWMGGAESGLSLSGMIEGKEREAAVKVLKALSSREYYEFMKKETNGATNPPFKELILPELSNQLALKYMESFSKATDMRNEITLYDPVSQVFPQTRIELQALLGGAKTPEETAATIQKIISDNE